MKTAEQIGKKLKVSGRHIRTLAERREIPFFEVGPRCLRFDEAEVMAALKRRPRSDQEETQT